MDLTYPEVGATRDGALPDGYRRIKARAQIGRGPRVFAAAARALRGFDMQREAGLRVRTQPGAEQVAVGVEVAMSLGIGPLRLWAPCRVVWAIDEPQRYGYGYGTLPGHPESGEEGFEVTLAPDDPVWFEVRAFSRPGHWFVKAAGPAGSLIQDWATDRYRAAIQRLATYQTG
jgi:uncharacterized protein (UPF0548 family)